jgi:SNF family Na+-dependent transporter
MHPRLAGVGLASVWSGFVIVMYYVPIIAYAIYYFVLSFVSPIMWSGNGIIQKCPHVAPATEFFYLNVLQVWKEDTCDFRSPGDTTGIAWPIFFCNVIAWVIVFACVMKGVKTASYIVYVSVPLPLVLIIIMIIRSNQLPGSGQGIELYLKGDGKKTIGEQLGAAGIWNDAVSQIFFSVGVCMGIMTSYGSYNKRDKPVLVDSFIIGLINSGVSFLAGFAVFSIIGYL